MHCSKHVLLSGLIAVAGTVTAAQAPGPLVFEAASIKRNVSNDSRMSLGGGGPGQFLGTNIPLWWLIRSAYQIQEFQLVGAPGWVMTERYDVAARSPPTTARGQSGAMQRALLTDRFKLKTHSETREMPVYALMLARPDGTLGPKLSPTRIANCDAVRDSPEPCGVSVNSGTLRARSTAVAGVASLLQQFVGRTIVDKTGLTGNFDVDLLWTAGLEAAAADGVSLFTALQEQLGLKLESARGPVQVLVVDSVERPTED